MSATGAALLGPDARTVCIVMLSAVGDSVHVLPVVNALKRHRPELAGARVLAPACSRKVEAGMDVARLNLSHGTYAVHEEVYANVRKAADDSGRAVAVLVDLQGPKIRLGKFAAGPTQLLTAVLPTGATRSGTEHLLQLYTDAFGAHPDDLEVGARLGQDRIQARPQPGPGRVTRNDDAELGDPGGVGAGVRRRGALSGGRVARYGGSDRAVFEPEGHPCVD